MNTTQPTHSALAYAAHVNGATVTAYGRPVAIAREELAALYETCADALIAGKRELADRLGWAVYQVQVEIKSCA